MIYIHNLNQIRREFGTRRVIEQEIDDQCQVRFVEVIKFT